MEACSDNHGFVSLVPPHESCTLYLGSLAAATANTWGTEIGVLSRGKTVSILTFRQVASGTSGGISEYGTIAGAAGAAVIAFTGYPWYTELRITIIIIAAGILGSLADSLIGATLQAQVQVFCLRKDDGAVVSLFTSDRLVARAEVDRQRPRKRDLYVGWSSGGMGDDAVLETLTVNDQLTTRHSRFTIISAYRTAHNRSATVSRFPSN